MSIVAPLLYPGCEFSEDACELKFKNIDIRFLPTSFFIYCKKDTEEKVAQMLLPAIIFKKQLCVPVNTFFKSLETLELFRVSIENNVITLKNYNEQIVSKPAPKLIEKKSEKGTIQAPEEEQTEELNTDTTTFTKPVGGDTALKSKREPFAIFERDKINPSEESIPERGTLLNAFYSISHFALEGMEYMQKIFNENKQSEPVQKVVPDTTPVRQSMREPEYKKYPPNLYVVPKNLIRKELNPSDSTEPAPDEQKKNDSEMNYNSIDENVRVNHKIPPADLLASNEIFTVPSNTQIIEINAVEKPGMTELHFIADNAINTFQNPDCSGKNLVIRILDAVNAVEDFSKSKNTGLVSSIKTELIRDILVYRIKLTSVLTKAEVHRNGPKELVYELSYDTAEKPKETEKKDTVKLVNTAVDEQEKLSDEEDTKEIKDVKKKWALDVIILDPGHGGFDSGTISVNGYKEKDVALDIALKLRELILDGMPETKVFMTREDDRFIELSNRTKFANEHKGKLFISIHLNATPKKPSNANGFETYILRPGRNDDAIRIANFENSVIKLEKPTQNTIKITDEDVILATMAQSAFVKFSEYFGRLLQDEVPKDTHLKNRGVNQAGFYVLVGASMPNVLIETAFLSNTEDEAFMTSKTGTSKVAKAIFRAIKKYSEEYVQLSH
jgi:N-acetylmuramoyl-L-alanine amidase